MTSNHTYISGSLYWVKYLKSGTYVVATEYYDANRIVFTGDYKACLKYLNNLKNIERMEKFS